MANMERCADCGKLAIVTDTVTISTEEYAALCRYAEIGRDRKTINSYRAISHSAIARNPALADFIVENAVTLTTSEVWRQAQEKFGNAVPSRSSVYRFMEQVRRSGKGAMR